MIPVISRDSIIWRSMALNTQRISKSKGLNIEIFQTGLTFCGARLVFGFSRYRFNSGQTFLSRWKNLFIWSREQSFVAYSIVCRYLGISIAFSVCLRLASQRGSLTKTRGKTYRAVFRLSLSLFRFIRYFLSLSSLSDFVAKFSMIFYWNDSMKPLISPVNHKTKQNSVWQATFTLLSEYFVFLVFYRSFLAFSNFCLSDHIFWKQMLTVSMAKKQPLEIFFMAKNGGLKRKTGQLLW